MDALEAILTRRSVREYTDRPVPAEALKQLLAAAMQAPYAGGEEPWHFVVIDDQNILSRIPAISPYVATGLGAPAAILVCADLRIPESRDVLVQGCATATENLLLAAHALGLGAVWTAVYPDADLMLGFANLFALPKDVAAIALVTVGYPAGRPPPKDRYHEERIHRNGW